MAEDGGTLVIEDGVISKLVRRPVDLVRMVGAVAGIVAIIAAATILMRTVSGIDADVADSAAKLPGFILVVLTTISGLGQLVLPTAVAIDLLNRRRGLQLAQAVAGGVLAALAAIGLAVVTRRYGSEDLWFALAGTGLRSDEPLQPMLAAVFAFLTVARLRGWVAGLASAILVSTLIADIVIGGYTVAAQGIAALAGWAVGLGIRYVFGTPTVRPRGVAIAQLLADHGLPITVLRATTSTDRGRRYVATTEAGKQLQVTVFDRDLEGAGVIPRWWRFLRLRDNDALGGWKMREAVDRAALMARSATAAGAPVPALRLVQPLGEDAVVLVSDWINGPSFAQLKSKSEPIDQATAVSAWQALAQLHQAGIAHRAITPSHLLRGDDGTVWLVHITSGAVAMSELQRRIDIADMLIATSVSSDIDTAIRAATETVGAKVLLAALPALQPFAVNPENRKALRGVEFNLAGLREAVAKLAPGQPLERIDIERLSPKRLLTILAGLVAAYVLYGQLAEVDIVGLFRSADYGWVGWAALMTALTFIGSAMSLHGFVVEKISAWRTLLAQFAASFATLVSPPALGTVAVNGRFLQREGMPAAAAGATVAVSQVLAFFIHIGLMFAAGIAAGTQQDFRFDPPREAVVIGLVVLLALTVILPLPMVRKYLVRVARPRLDEVVPRFIQVSQRPAKIATGIGGMLLLNIAFCLALFASVRAFSDSGSAAAIALVYLAGSTLGQAAPTPGGVGAVETVMTAGLVTAGVDSGVALSAVLLFRLLTFWLPTIPGWLAFQYLSRRGSL